MHWLRIILCIGCIACTQTVDEISPGSRAEPEMIAKDVRMEIAFERNPIVVEGRALKISGHQHTIAISNDASLTSRGPQPFTAEADNILVYVKDQRIALTGNVKSRFPFSIFIDKESN